MDIEIFAYYKDTPATPLFARVSYSLSPEQVAALPKSLRLRSTTAEGRRFQDTITLHKNGVVGDKNESGIRRLHKLLAVGAVFKTTDATGNAYRDLDEFLAAL